MVGTLCTLQVDCRQQSRCHSGCQTVICRKNVENLSTSQTNPHTAGMSFKLLHRIHAATLHQRYSPKALRIVPTPPSAIFLCGGIFLWSHALLIPCPKLPGGAFSLFVKPHWKKRSAPAVAIHQSHCKEATVYENIPQPHQRWDWHILPKNPLNLSQRSIRCD